MGLFIFAAVTPDQVSGRLDQVIAIFDGLQKVALVVTAFVTTGIGGLLVAYRAVRSQLKQVERNVAPAVSDAQQIRREVSSDAGAAPGDDDTLRMKVEAIATTVESERRLRGEQHEDNSKRLDDIQTDLAETRRLVAKILGKLAGL